MDITADSSSSSLFAILSRAAAFTQKGHFFSTQKTLQHFTNISAANKWLPVACGCCKRAKKHSVQLQQQHQHRQDNRFITRLTNNSKKKRGKPSKGICVCSAAAGTHFKVSDPSPLTVKQVKDGTLCFGCFSLSIYFQFFILHTNNQI